MLKEDVIAVIEAIPEEDFNDVFYQLDFFPGDFNAVRTAIEEAAKKAGLTEERNDSQGCTSFKREYEGGQYTDGTITIFDK